MKFVMMIYCNPVNWGHPSFLYTKEAEGMSQAERDEMARGLDEMIDELHESGELLSVTALADPLTSRTIRTHGNAVVATDGPYIESKEQMAGLFLLDCPDIERAQEILRASPTPVSTSSSCGRSWACPGRGCDLIKDFAPQVTGALVRR